MRRPPSCVVRNGLDAYAVPRVVFGNALMDKTVVAELSATLAALRSAGETGFWILALFLLVVISLMVVAVIYQRIVINRFQSASKATEERLRSVDAQLKTIDTSLKERELGIKERDELR